MSPVDELFSFEPPLEGATFNFEAAERQALRFPEAFVKKARELSQTVQERDRAWQEVDRVQGLIVRNLVILANNCKAALAAPVPPDSDDAAIPPPESENLPPASAPGIEAAALAGVNRMVIHLLQELGVHRVDLLGHTYEDVTFEGQKIEDPFEVLHSDVKGKLSEIAVREVESDLWVARRGGEFKVLYRGKVNC